MNRYQFVLVDHFPFFHSILFGGYRVFWFGSFSVCFFFNYGICSSTLLEWNLELKGKVVWKSLWKQNQFGSFMKQTDKNQFGNLALKKKSFWNSCREKKGLKVLLEAKFVWKSWEAAMFFIVTLIFILPTPTYLIFWVSFILFVVFLFLLFSVSIARPPPLPKPQHPDPSARALLSPIIVLEKCAKVVTVQFCVRLAFGEFSTPCSSLVLSGSLATLGWVTSSSATCAHRSMVWREEAAISVSTNATHRLPRACTRNHPKYRR